MSELTLSLKNKKTSSGATGRPNENTNSNAIKPLISAGRIPQSTKNAPDNIENFSARTYTQRVGAKTNATTNAARGINSIQKNQIAKQ